MEIFQSKLPLIGQEMGITISPEVDLIIEEEVDRVQENLIANCVETMSFCR